MLRTTSQLKYNGFNLRQSFFVGCFSLLSAAHTKQCLAVDRRGGKDETFHPWEKKLIFRSFIPGPRHNSLLLRRCLVHGAFSNSLCYSTSLNFLPGFKGVVSNSFSAEENQATKVMPNCFVIQSY